MQNERSYWRRWYIGVLLFLAVLVFIFYLITKTYS